MEGIYRGQEGEPARQLYERADTIYAYLPPHLQEEFRALVERVKSDPFSVTDTLARWLRDHRND